MAADLAVELVHDRGVAVVRSDVPVRHEQSFDVALEPKASIELGRDDAMQRLLMAREEAAEANYQDAIRFAERANEFGTKARDMARRRMREMGR